MDNKRDIFVMEKYSIPFSKSRESIQNPGHTIQMELKGH